jgi:hypothetical protein
MKGEEPENAKESSVERERMLTILRFRGAA